MIEKPEAVRFAAPGDEHQLFELLVKNHIENEIARLFPYDADTVYATFRRGIAGDGGVIGVIEEDGRIVGTICLLRDRWWWSRDAELQNAKWLFVLPEARRRGAYYSALFQFGEWVRASVDRQCRAAGTPWPYLWEFGFEALDRVEARERLWGRFGKKVGSLFISGL